MIYPRHDNPYTTLSIDIYSIGHSMAQPKNQGRLHLLHLRNLAEVEPHAALVTRLDLGLVDQAQGLPPLKNNIYRSDRDIDLI